MVRERYTEIIRQVAVNVSGSTIDSVRRKDITRTGFRVYSDGLIGTAGAIGIFDEPMLWEKAEKALERGVEYPFGLSPERRQSLDSTRIQLQAGEFLEEAEALVEGLIGMAPGLLFTNKVLLSVYRRSLHNDLGLDLENVYDELSVDLMFKQKGSSGILDGFLIPSSMARYDRSLLLEEYGSFCEAFSTPVDLPEGRKLPVMLTRENWSMPLRKLYTDLSGLSIGSGASLLSGRIGEKVFSEGLTLLQCSDPKRGCGPFFDMEGVVNEGFTLPLVDEGVVRTAFTDKRTAERFGLPLTGAAGGAFDGVPCLSLPGLVPDSSDRTASELLRGDPGVLIVFAAGGEFKPDGAFATPVQLAMLHDGSRLLGRLPELRVSSHLFRIFGDDFRGVSCDSASALTDDGFMIFDADVERA
ncbi:hypothetical protein JW921_09805 [Candidatus Fermentibacterales bacterium]|nr:hypothetical protein [Candidatus Fermentibacterales bacterium]